jgi:hypothetical protein
MESRDLGVRKDYVDAAFKRDEEPRSDGGFQARAMLERREFFMSRDEQMADLAHIQENRPLGRPGTAGWRHAASPMTGRALACREAAEAYRKTLA